MEYKTGWMNVVANALSRWDTKQVIAMALSSPSINLMEEFRLAASIDSELVALHEQLTVGTLSMPWVVVDDLVTYQGRLYVPLTSTLLLL